MPALAATAVAVAASLFVLAAYCVPASKLLVYPWDWSPDEGLYLDYARRLGDSFEALNPRSFVPFPSAYGPLLPALLAPVLGVPAGALFGARLVALGWTLLCTLAVYALVRRSGFALLALAACALSLAPLDLTFWHMLVRPDGLMLALWLLAAIPLLPAALARGADRLSGPRIAAGTALLVAACMAKPTAIVHGAPLVLGWLLVDRRSALRLALWLGLGGLLATLALQWATAGGFLWVNRIWAYHPSQPWQPRVLVGYFLDRAWPLLVLAAATRRRGLLRDSSWLLIAGALLVLPLTAKFGASWNYLVPAVPILAIAIARWWADAGTLWRMPRATAGAALVALLALALALTREFPLPTPTDERTARAFYSYVIGHTRTTGGKILTLRPELASFLVGQPVEMEGSGFFFLARGRAPGTELVLDRLQQARYGLVVVTWPLPDTNGYQEAVERSYVPAGGCKLGYYFGPVTATLLPRRDIFQTFSPPALARCWGVADTRPPAS